MATRKNKRLSISEQLKELRDMREASKRRQKGERVTSDQVTATRKAAEAEAASNARRQRVDGGMGKPKPKPKPTPAPTKPKPQPAKPEPKPQPAKPKPTKQTANEDLSIKSDNPKPKVDRRAARRGGSSSRVGNPTERVMGAIRAVDNALKLTHKKGHRKKIGGVMHMWNGKKWVELGRDF